MNDAQALRSDWAQVGHDIGVAASKFADENGDHGCKA